ncbi:MAG: hypothetical protein KBD78_09405 [Oligoflexales bacterium]|nr:hypothetical protein [Oligoflexales bacterium]
MNLFRILELVFATAIFFSHGKLQAECIQSDAKELRTSIAKNKSTKEIIFFATWCQACLQKLKTADNSKSIVVAVFESKKNADQTQKQIVDAKVPCFWDKDGSIAREFKVKSLPQVNIL